MVTRDKKRYQPKCPKCEHPDFTIVAANDGRPKFICEHCKYVWSQGLDGGEYAAWAIHPKT